MPTFAPALQTLLGNIGDDAAKSAITDLLNHSPSLLAMYNALATGSNGAAKLTRIEFIADQTDKSGSFNSATGILHIEP